MAFDAEPSVRIHILEDAGYYIDDSVFDIDAQVARQLEVEGLAEIVAAEDPYDVISILAGPAGIGSSW